MIREPYNLNPYNSTIDTSKVNNFSFTFSGDELGSWNIEIAKNNTSPEIVYTSEEFVPEDVGYTHIYDDDIVEGITLPSTITHSQGDDGLLRRLYSINGYPFNAAVVKLNVNGIENIGNIKGSTANGYLVATNYSLGRTGSNVTIIGFDRDGTTIGSQVTDGTYDFLGYLLSVKENSNIEIGQVVQIGENSFVIGSIEDAGDGYSELTIVNGEATSSDVTPILTFDSLAEADATELTVGIEPVQDLSHGDPSPSNICPISGWDSVDLWNDPKYGGTIKWNQLMQNGNFADGSSGWSGGSASLTVSNGIARATLTGGTWNNEVRNNSAIVVDSHIYLCSALVRLSSANFHVTFRNTGGQLSLNNNFNSTAWSKYESLIKVTSHSQDGFAVTVRENGSALAGEWFEAQNFNAFDLTAMFGSTVAEYIYSLEQATTGAGVAYFRNLFPQDYYPYDDSYTETCVSAVNGDAYLRYQIQLGQTVYGGTLDMVTGVLTVTHGNIASYNGETLPSTWISDRDVYASGTTPTTGAQVVYELATPLTYQLTSQQIKTLAGTNNVWASSGDIVSVKFTYETN